MDSELNFSKKMDNLISKCVQDAKRILQLERAILAGRLIECSELIPTPWEQFMTTLRRCIFSDPMEFYRTLPATDPCLDKIYSLEVIPEHEVFVCSINRQIVIDPVMVNAHIYERETISEWIRYPHSRYDSGVWMSNPPKDPTNPELAISERDIRPVPFRYLELLARYLELRLN